MKTILRKKPAAVYLAALGLISSILAFYFFSQDIEATFFGWIQSLPDNRIGLAIIATIFTGLIFLSVLYHLNYSKDSLIEEKDQEISELIEKRDQEVHDLGLAIDDLKLLIKHKDEIARIDLITGVPNELAFEISFDKLINDIKHKGLTYTVIYLDLVDFKKLNDNHGQSAADKIMRKFAQDFMLSMRRNENFYRYRKTQIDFEPESNMFRRYRGGDEFFVTLFASELDTLFFIKRMDNHFNEEVKQKEFGALINQPTLALKFHAGITEIMLIDDYESLKSRAEDLLGRSKAGQNGSRLFWSSEETKGKYGEILEHFSSK